MRMLKIIKGIDRQFIFDFRFVIIVYVISKNINFKILRDRNCKEIKKKIFFRLDI